MMKHRFGNACASVVLAATLAFGMAPAAAWAEAGSEVESALAAATATPDTSWYDAAKTTYTLKNISQIAGLGDLVASGVDFAGKTVTLAGDVNGRNTSITPIGTAEKPFNGTFDGAGKTIDNITIDSSANTCVGLFGYAGANSTIQNLTLGKAAKITRSVTAEEGDFLSDVGLLVGRSEGSIVGCTVRGTLKLDSAAPQKSATETFVIERVGGLAGTCYGSLVDCTFAGLIDIAATTDPVSEYDEAVLVKYVGGVVGYQGDVTKSETTSTASSHGSIVNCVNEGSGSGDNNKNDSIKIDTPSEAGTDRFGMAVSAQSSNVGGIAGYARGNVSACTNYGYLNIENATLAGGIVGALRSVESTSNGNYSGEGSDEGSADDPIVASECVNIGIVYARSAVGGIAGQAGTYTTITGCMNGRDRSKRETLVVGTRWNKPFVAGIVGRTYGDVSFCGNLGIVASATWDNEAACTLKGASGYYSAGIAGGVLYYTKTDTSSGVQVRNSPLSTAYNNYNAGSIETKAGFRARHIVGNNEGYVYDNTALDGSCPDAQMTYGEVSTDDDAIGTAANNFICTDKVDASGKVVQRAADSLKGTAPMHYRYRTVKDGEEVMAEGDMDSVFELLNSTAASSGWETYWTASNGTDNSGFPVLNWQVTGYTKKDISAASLTLEANATYTGTESIPTVSATLNGVKLLQNVDYRVVPQGGAIARTSDKPYRATIVGIGRYEGTSTASVAYGIDKGDLSQCTAVIDSKVFNWEAQKPADVTVKNSAGVALDASEFTWELSGEAVNAGMYDVSITATDASDYEGTLTGTFVISKAKFMSTFSLDGQASISYLGKDYPWYSSTNSTSEADESKIPVFDYTGYSVKPEVKGVNYLDRELVQDRDYIVLYGDLGSDGSTDSENIHVSKNNIGEAGKTCWGSVMVRYVAGSNFSNYENMLIKIADRGIQAQLDESCIDLPEGGVPYEGGSVCPVKVYYGGNRLVEGTDYTITYSNNDAVGQASYTVIGMGRFEGTVSGTFDIVAADPFEYAWDIITVNGAQVARITGFTYTGTSEGKLDLVIPAQVERDGVSYPVAIIGEDAFGGPNGSDYEGDYRDCKKRIASVTVPASVTTIEDYAFGGEATAHPDIEKVIFEKSSKLATIGECAFQYCSNLSEFHFPAGVTTIGKKAFAQCSKLLLLDFETASAFLPSSVGSNSFLNVGGAQTSVRVVGRSEASAVVALAKGNAAKSGASANGGHNFAFVAYAGDLAQADIAAVSDQEVVEGSSKAVEPELSVTLGGVKLTAGVDYAVSYANNTAPGQATATITGLGGYVGTNSVTFNIVSKHVATVKRLSGATRLDTMGNIVSEGFEQSDTVVVATAQSFPDALSASALAGAYGAPIVLTDNGALSDQAKQQIGRLGATKALVMGGEAALSSAVLSDLAAMGVSAERVAGATRQATSLESLNKVVAAARAAGGSVDTVVLARADNAADSLSISPFSYAKNAPVVLVESDKLLSSEAVAAIKASGATRVVIVGGEACVSDGVQAQLPGLSFERWYGQTRYETSLNIAKHELAEGLSLSCVCVATGEKFPDALAGGPLAGSRGGILVLTNGSDMTFADKLLAPSASQVDACYLLGGEAVLPASLETYLKELLQ